MTEAVTRALLGPVTPAMPLSYGQEFAARGGDLQMVVDVVAAKDILARRVELERRGVQVIDNSTVSASIAVRDLVFCRDPEEGLC